MKYEAPVVDVVILNTEDVVMISGLSIKEEGTLTQVSWESIT